MIRVHRHFETGGLGQEQDVAGFDLEPVATPVVATNHVEAVGDRDTGDARLPRIAQAVPVPVVEDNAARGLGQRLHMSEAGRGQQCGSGQQSAESPRHPGH